MGGFFKLLYVENFVNGIRKPKVLDDPFSSHCLNFFGRITQFFQDLFCMLPFKRRGEPQLARGST
jgi:hypothetical protein